MPTSRGSARSSITKIVPLAAGRAAAAVYAVIAAVAFAAERPASAGRPNVADVDAAARAEGNRRPLALAIGRSIFAGTWPAQVLKIRVDGIGPDAVAALNVSAVKFHRTIDLAAFEDEILALVRAAFAAAPVEEVDVEAEQPLRVGEHAVVSGDLALPTKRIVFAVTVRRGDLNALPGKLRAGTDVFVAPDFRARMTRE